MKLPKFEVITKDGWRECNVPCLPLEIKIVKGYSNPKSKRWEVYLDWYANLSGKEFNKLERAVEYAVKETMKDIRLEIADLQSDLKKIKDAVQEESNG